MSIATFTALHVVISLVGIGSGLVVLVGLVGGKRLDLWTATFLWTTVLTSLTGYAFPINGLTPAHIIGAISLVALTVAIVGLYRFRLAGAWRKAFVAASVTALYLNIFVGVVQAFQKIPVLRASAPTQSEPSFVIAHLLALALCTAMGILASTRFREAPARAHASAGMA